jgi:hypothetical protein
VFFQNGLDDRPGSLDGLLAGEQRPVTRQGVCEEAFVGLLLVRLTIEQRELTLVAGELLVRALVPGGFSSTTTSVAVSARHLPDRTYQGTPAQRHESMNSRRAQKVSTSESAATPGSSR